MWMEIIAAVAVVLFAVLVFFLVRTLIALRRALLRTDHLIFDMETKLKSFDAPLRMIANLGDIGQTETERLKRSYWAHRSYAPSSSSQAPHADDQHELVADWLRTSIKLGYNLFFKG